MNCWMGIALLLFIHTVGSEGAGNVIEIGQGRCQRRWTVPERRLETYSVREMCKYYERCYYKTVTKTRTQIVDKPMHVNFCCVGYINRSSIFDLVCEPNCQPMCVNGQCTAPGNCTCHDGYGKSPTSDHICEHKCVPECVNATCVGVNECDCYAGFFKKDPAVPHTCSPRCTFGCINGDCTAPETCTCHRGFTLSSNRSVCIPICDLECTNGFCSAPNTCTCNEGHVETTNWNVCDPYCSEPCVNGECTSPENCTCWDGYFEISNSTCEPHCTNPCRNGACIAPEICSCYEGYEKDENDTCIPICSLGCENGTCVSPEHCHCGDFHYFSNGTCLPWCAEGCTNGDCIGPEGCDCHPGTLKLSQAYCTESCSNDTCIAYSSSIDANDNSTTLILNSSMEKWICAQQYSESCCSIGHNWTLNDPLIIVCSPKDAYAECSTDQMSLPYYSWTQQYSERSDTNTSVVISISMPVGYDMEEEARPCYSRLCPGPSLGFVSGFTRILCSKDPDVGDIELSGPHSDHQAVTATVGALIFLISVAILTAIVYYIKRIKKISYDVNDEAAGECTAHLYHDQEVSLEAEL